MSEQKQTIKKLQSTKCMRLRFKKSIMQPQAERQKQVNNVTGPFYSFISTTLKLVFCLSFIIKQSNPLQSFLLRWVFHKSVTGNRQKIVTAKQKPLSHPCVISLLDRYTVKLEIVINLWLRCIKAMPGLHLEMRFCITKPSVSPQRHGWITEWVYWAQAQGPKEPGALLDSPAGCDAKGHRLTTKIHKMTTRRGKMITTRHKTNT